MLQKFFRRAAELDHLPIVGALALHRLQRRRLEHLHRLDVHVAVSDLHLAFRITSRAQRGILWKRDFDQEPAALTTARLANTLTISRRYSGVSAEVVSGLATRAASSPTTAAACSISPALLPASACIASGTM